MMAIAFIAAVIGLTLAVKYLLMWVTSRQQGNPVEKDGILGENGIIATKEYFLANRIIKY